MAHAGSERWFEITSPASSPLFLASDKVQGNNTAINVYRTTLATSLVAQCGGATSNFCYLPAAAQPTRYIIEKWRR